MNRLILALVLSVGCSAPRATGTPRPDAVMSGDTTAKTASEAARKAEKENNTGLITASSNQGETAAQPEPTTQPTPEPAASSTLEVQFVKGTLTMNGEPVSDFEKVAADAIAADPEVVLSITSGEEVPQAKIAEVTDAAKAAGIKRVKVQITIPPVEEEKSDAPEKPTSEEKPASP